MKKKFKTRKIGSWCHKKKKKIVEPQRGAQGRGSVTLHVGARGKEMRGNYNLAGGGELAGGWCEGKKQPENGSSLTCRGDPQKRG